MRVSNARNIKLEIHVRKACEQRGQKNKKDGYQLNDLNTEVFLVIRIYYEYLFAVRNLHRYQYV